MTATFVEATTPPLQLLGADRPERPCILAPLDEQGFLVAVHEAYPTWTHVCQRHRNQGETIHIFREDRPFGDYAVVIRRDNGQHGVKESGTLYDKLLELGGMWKATQCPQRGGLR